jgi:hypothetical protein
MNIAEIKTKLTRSFRKEGTKVEETTRLSPQLSQKLSDRVPLDAFISAEQKQTIDGAKLDAKAKADEQTQMEQRRIEARVNKDLTAQQLSKEQPDLKALIEKYKTRLTMADYDAGEKGIRARVELIQSEERYNKTLRDVRNESQSTADERVHAALFTQPRVSTAEVFHVAKEGYYITHDNGRVFVQLEKDYGKQLFHGLIKAQGGGPSAVLIGNGRKYVTEIDEKEFAEILKSKPSYAQLTKAYSLFANHSLTVPTENTTRIW